MLHEKQQPVLSTGWLIFVLNKNCLKTLLLLFIFTPPLLVVAQQQPLPIEPATIIAPGHVGIDFGFSYFRNQNFPLSGLSGNLYKLGNLRFHISLSKYVELQTDGTLLDVLYVHDRKPAFNSAIASTRNPTGDIGDFTIWTKFGILREYQSDIGFSMRIGVQLPNASNESGLGIDEMNFYSTFLIEKHFAGLWIANVGLGILGDPTRLSSQHDVCTYGIEYFFPVAASTTVTMQHGGRVGHSGIGITRLRNWKIGVQETCSSHFFVDLYGVKNTSVDDKSAGAELTFHVLFQVMDIK